MPLAARRRRRTVAAEGGAVVVAHGINRRGDRRRTAGMTEGTGVMTEGTGVMTAATDDDSNGVLEYCLQRLIATSAPASPASGGSGAVTLGAQPGLGRAERTGHERNSRRR